MVKVGEEVKRSESKGYHNNGGELKVCIYACKYGIEVYPASWEPGKNTLKPGLDLVGKI
ncbi:MAG: hypothetical protein ABIM60_01750 [candidate division WOR-3 bacterium]